jgi:hypothetical protein
MGYQWTCPYCNRPCTVDDNDVRSMSDHNHISKEYGYYRSTTTIIVCPNPKCRQQTISMKIEPASQHGTVTGKPIFSWNLLPESEAKPFPDYIPKQLRDDYSEACLIRNKSPKASATLSRRCLQGIEFQAQKSGKLALPLDSHPPSSPHPSLFISLPSPFFPLPFFPSYGP